MTYQDALMCLASMGIALVLGFAIGIERKLRFKEAGTRTHTIMCVGACLYMLISQYAFTDGDPGRIAAQVVSGIGFIGAGAVLRNGPMIFGLTTAATLWIAAAIGMACGAGLFSVGLATTLFAVAVLTLVRIIEKHVLPSGNRTVKRYDVTLYCTENDETAVRVFFEKNFTVNSLSVKNSSTSEGLLKIKANIDLNKRKKINSLYDDIKNICNVNSISILEVND